MIKVRFPDGTEIEASSYEEVVRTAFVLGKTEEDGIHYYSESRGEKVEITSMANIHLQNAILKIVRKKLEELGKEKDLVKFVTAFQEGIGSDSITVLAMLSELVTRVKAVTDDPK